MATTPIVAPYFVFRDAGVQLTLASTKGGQPPVDPKSDLPENQTAAMDRVLGRAATTWNSVEVSHEHAEAA